MDQELWQLLKGVSRSFYLSVRFLPRKVRPAIALGYLAARASDTIADANSLEAERRLEVLRQLRAQLFSLDPELKTNLQACAKCQPDRRERQLLQEIDLVFGRIRALPLEQQDLLREVLEHIIRGQALDIERFEVASSLCALRSKEELEEYIYLVAGSVGEFWTKLCLQQFSAYSRIIASEIISWGIEYGKGLQLVNVLRDFPNDVQSGRSYLPVTDPGSLSKDLRAAQLLFSEWRSVTAVYLDSGARYVRAIRPARIKFACALPVLIGRETLKKLGTLPSAGKKVKVSRKRVYWLAILSLIIAVVPGAAKVLLPLRTGNLAAAG
jgi:farnesyl-diphosphate farnesyltransferase